MLNETNSLYQYEKIYSTEKELINLTSARNEKNDFWWCNGWRKTKDGN